MLLPPDSAFVRILFAGVAPREGGDAFSAEDSFAVQWNDEGRLRAAVADGASDGVFSDVWANLLTSAWVKEWNNLALPPLDLLRGIWRHPESAIEKPLPWNVAARAAKGTSAAFLGLIISADGNWSAIAVGDCVLVQLHRRKVNVAFPIARAEDFPNLPLLLHTDPAQSAEASAQTSNGVWETGDEILLMTDALAAWFLREAEQGKEPIQWLRGLSAGETFEDRLRQLKASGRLRDDDATLIHFQFTE